MTEATEEIQAPSFADTLVGKVRKKGARSWVKANLLDIPSDWKDPRLKYRWVDRGDPMKIWQREERGYVLANAESGGGLPANLPPDQLGNFLGTTPVRRDLVLMVADASVEKEHNERVAKATDHTVHGMKAERNDEFDKLAREHGIAGARLNSRLVIE